MPDDGVEDYLDGLTSPVQLNSKPDDRGHDSIQYGPEAYRGCQRWSNIQTMAALPPRIPQALQRLYC